MKLQRSPAIMLFLCCLLPAGVVAQPACSPAATNISCATSVLLGANAACVTGTSCSGGTQGASTCLYAGSQCVWYRFTATGTNMYVNIDVTATDGCHISSNVYSSTGPCTGLAQVSCLSGAPLDDLHSLTGLTIGNIYYIQVCYAPGGPCGNSGSAQFCIEVGVPDPPCNTCSTPCGDAFGYTTAPTVAQVVADCQSVPFQPPLQPGTAQTFCNTFTATNSTVSFNVVITSDCGAGNVTDFSWSLYNSPSCGGAIQTGTLASLNFTGLTVGNSYVYCYTFTVPTTCSHTLHCPYFVGATVPLPVTWIGFDAWPNADGQVELDWATGSELNNAYYTVERSIDAIRFEEAGTVAAMGNSSSVTNYHALDARPYPGTSYYRIRQTDNDGTYSFTSVVAVIINDVFSNAMIIPNPGQGDVMVAFNAMERGNLEVRISDASGRVVLLRSAMAQEGANRILLGTGQLAKGIYTVSVGMPDDLLTLRFVRE